MRQTERRELSLADRVIGGTLGTAGLAIVMGSVIYAAPLMFDQGPGSMRAVVFLGSAAAAVLIAGCAVLGVVSRMRHC
jgi:hypothetical protein